MCMGTNMFMDVLLMVIDYVFDALFMRYYGLCCLCNQENSFTSNTDVVLPPSGNHVAGGTERNDIQHVDFGIHG